VIETERLRLRAWQDADVAPFHAICSDPQVMATLGPLLTREQTAALVQRMRDLQARDGHCFWAVERRDDARLIGWCGLIRGTAGPVDGKAEIGWRLAGDCWGQGYASEGARAALAWAFRNLDDPAVYAITSMGNHRSRAVMERIGMVYVEGGDFDHPGVPKDSPLLRHVLYRADRPG
jgi:RimJ/RimL family protein N-acetyltransferase